MAKGIRINKRNLGVKRKSKSKHKKKNAAAVLLKAKLAGEEIVHQQVLSKRQKRIAKKIQQRKEKAKLSMEVEGITDSKKSKAVNKKKQKEEMGDGMIVE